MPHGLDQLKGNFPPLFGQIEAGMLQGPVVVVVSKPHYQRPEENRERQRKWGMYQPKKVITHCTTLPCKHLHKNSAKDCNKKCLLATVLQSLLYSLLPGAT
jgi:hypothetical protein